MPETNFMKLQEIPSHFLDDLQHKLHALMKPGLLGSASLLEPSISGSDTILVSAIPAGEAVVSNHTWMGELKPASYKFTTEDSGTYKIYIDSYLTDGDGDDPYYQAESKVTTDDLDQSRYLVIGQVDWNGSVLSNLVDLCAGKTDAAAYPHDFVSGGETYTATSNTVKIKPGSWRSDDGSADLNAVFELTVDRTAEGAGGLDHSTPAAADTWYFIWVILNPITGEAAGLLSQSFTDPTLPSGYTKKRRVGSVFNYSANLREFWSFGKGREKKVFYERDFIYYNQDASATWTERNVSDFVPETADIALTTCKGSDPTDDFKISWRPFGSTLTDGHTFGYSKQGHVVRHEIPILIDTADSNNRKFETIASAAGGLVTFSMDGYIDRL